MTTGRINQITNFELSKPAERFSALLRFQLIEAFASYAFVFSTIATSCDAKSIPEERRRPSRTASFKPPLRSPASASFLYHATVFIAQPPRRIQHHCTASMSALDVRPTVDSTASHIYSNKPSYGRRLVFATFFFFDARTTSGAYFWGIWLPQESHYCITRVLLRHLATSRESLTTTSREFLSCADANFCSVYLFFNVKTSFNLVFLSLHVLNYAHMNLGDVWWSNKHFIPLASWVATACLFLARSNLHFLTQLKIRHVFLVSNKSWVFSLCLLLLSSQH